MSAARALAVVGLVFAAATLVAQETTPSTGPVIDTAGPVFDVVDPDFATPLDQDYKLAFEMARPSASPSEPNVVLVSAARFLNMHARAGVPEANLGAAVVVHGGAGWELLNNPAYRARHGVDNPNTALIRELTRAGVRVILCGQTAAARGIPRGELASEVQVALSAMTAFLVLQEDGFRPNPW
jgi:intracellular sulfur oxidation DsrE/DsrF family protein